MHQATLFVQTEKFLTTTNILVESSFSRNHFHLMTRNCLLRKLVNLKLFIVEVG